MTIHTKRTCTTLLAGALSLAALPGCLGGKPGQAEPDAAAANGNGNGGDAGNGNGNGADAAPLTCDDVMADAPTGDSAPSFRDALPTATRNTWDGSTIPTAGDEDYPGGKYRTIEADTDGNIHPGCSTEGLTYEPAQIDGYPCAAKEYPFPEGVSEDTSKPIVLLIHGNSDSPSGWEAFLDENAEETWIDTEERPQLAELLPEAGYRTIAIDLRIALMDDPTDANPAYNIDHGWSVPITQELLRAVIDNNPERDVAIVGFSLGGTVIRDAVRRLWVEWYDEAWDKNVFAHLSHLISASGASHGVSTYPALCGENTTMMGLVACEMGNRVGYNPTEFHEPLNGPAIGGLEEFGGWYETPCADGDYAFGQTEACGGSSVSYTTIAMKDNDDGSFEDRFTSEHATRLYPSACADNVVNPQSAIDTSGYFRDKAKLENHYGSVRSDTGIQVVIDALAE